MVKQRRMILVLLIFAVLYIFTGIYVDGENGDRYWFLKKSATFKFYFKHPPYDKIESKIELTKEEEKILKDYNQFVKNNSFSLYIY